MSTETIAMIVGLCASASGIFRRNERNDNRVAGKNEGTILTDIAHIKSSVDRMEKNINSVDERYTSMTERLARVEESVENIQKRLEEMHEKGGD